MLTFYDLAIAQLKHSSYGKRPAKTVHSEAGVATGVLGVVGSAKGWGHGRGCWDSYGSIVWTHDSDENVCCCVRAMYWEARKRFRQVLGLLLLGEKRGGILR